MTCSKENMSQEKNQNKSIWTVILAAGQSSRMGCSKSLLPIPVSHEKLKSSKSLEETSLPLLRYLAKKALKAGPVAVVLHQNSKKEEEALSGLPVSVLFPNTEFPEMSDSLKATIQFAKTTVHAKGVVILLGDEPDVDPKVIQMIMDTFNRSQGTSIVQAHYNNGPGHPVLFSETIYGELLTVKGDHGARTIIKAHESEILKVHIPKNKPMDLDTPEDYQTYLKAVLAIIVDFNQLPKRFFDSFQ